MDNNQIGILISRYTNEEELKQQYKEKNISYIKQLPKEYTVS